MDFSAEERSLGRSLVLATKIRLVLDELAGRLATRKRDDDVIGTLMVLTGIIEQDTVVGALRLYERGKVKLFGLKERGRERQPSVSVEVDENEELDRLIARLDVRRDAEEYRRLPEAKITIPPRACHGRRGMLVAQVTCSPDRFLFPEANYCECDHFARRVLEKRCSFTCVHWLAVWLAMAMGQKVEETPLDSLLLMRRAVVGVGDEEPAGDRS